MAKKTVSLVLGSGGARGLAHVGVIRCLEEKGYEIVSVSGCSMGALIGGFYAAGRLDAYTQWLADSDLLDIVKLVDFKGSAGLVSGVELMKKIQTLLGGDRKIETLNIKYTAVASDVKGEKEIWIARGSLLDAIRASISLPLFFEPYRIHGRELIDGGVLNPVPIAPTFDDKTDLTIAVNLGAPADPSLERKEAEKPDTLSEKLLAYLKDIAIPDYFTEQESMYRIADRSFDAMQGTIARMKLAAYPPDITIDIPRNLCGTLEFTRSEEMIAYGYEKCQSMFG